MAQSDARTIVPLMAFATAGALVGHLGEPDATKKLDPKVGDAQILLGGTAATMILVLLSMAGDVGSTFAKGLSVVTLISVIGIYGGSLVKALDNLTGQTVPQAEGQTPTTTTTKAKAS